MRYLWECVQKPAGRLMYKTPELYDAHMKGPHVGLVCACGRNKYRYSFKCRGCDDADKMNRAYERSAVPVRVPTPVDIAWAAGLYEGEGCCQPASKTSLEITVGQNERQILDWLVEMFGGTIGLRPPAWHKRGYMTKDFHVWTLCGRRAFEFADAIAPFLSDRRLVQLKKARRGR